MEKIVLNATRRDVIGKHVKTLRCEGKLPAVLYGYGVESTPISMDLREVSKILAHVGSSTLVTVDLDGKEYDVLVRERQRDAILRTLLHVDFQTVSLTETIRAQVSIVLGEEEAPAVDHYGAILIFGMETLEVEALPQNLPENIVVDVSILESIGDSIRVKDLILPEGVEVLGDLNAMVVAASAPTLEEKEEDEVEAAPGLSEPDVIEKGKQEEETE
ncbi:MAG: 50S ribosomal protein L25 [Chloroflexi bacterium]|nr:50S ribosomal protein L25 [Chloroflexota bacterium]MBU1660414.1 50S ribosomal protein L25 [Chloroflexota bacterium]